MVVFAAFTRHISFYPPIRRHSKTPKSRIAVCGRRAILVFYSINLIPYGLIKRITKLRVKQNRAKHAASAKRNHRRVTPRERCGSGINAESLPHLWFKSAFRIFRQVIGKFDPTGLATHVSVVHRRQPSGFSRLHVVTSISSGKSTYSKVKLCAAPRTEAPRALRRRSKPLRPTADKPEL